MSFADYFPEDCPPADTVPAYGTVYRCVQDQVLTETDFWDHVQNGRRPDANFCERCAISVFRTLREAAHIRRKYPKLGRFIAVGTLEAAHGMRDHADEKTGHINWWPYADIHRMAIFSLVPEPE